MKKIASVLTVLVFAVIFSGCPDGKLDPNPQPLDFGNVYVGTSATGQASWTNNGNVQATITGMFVSSPPTFTGPAGPIDEDVDAGANSSRFTFTFNPTQSGTANGEAQIAASGIRPKKLRLTGVGVYKKDSAAIALLDLPADSALDFERVPVTTSKTKTFKLKNKTLFPITVRPSYKNGNNGFAVTNPAGDITIPANGEVTVTLTFTPAAVADYANIVEFTDTADAANITGTMVKGKGVQG